MNAAPNDPNNELQRPDLPVVGEAISFWFAISCPLTGPVIGFLDAGGLESLDYKEIPELSPRPIMSLSSIKAFGINHAERWSSYTADLPSIDSYGRYEM